MKIYMVSLLHRATIINIIQSQVVSKSCYASVRSRVLRSFLLTNYQCVPYDVSQQTTMLYYLHRLVAQWLVWRAGPEKRGPISGPSAHAREIILCSSDRYSIS